MVPHLEQTLSRVGDLLDRAEAAVDRIEQPTGDADTAVCSAVPLLDELAEIVVRVGPVVAGAEHSVQRVDAVVGQADSSVQRVDAVVALAEQSVQRVDSVVGRAEDSVQHVNAVVSGAETAVTRATAAVTSAQDLLGRSDSLLAQAMPALQRLLPVVERIAETVEPHEVDAAVLLVDRLPELLRAVDDDLLPLARQLKGVGPELHSLLELVEDLHAMVARLPGMKLIRRREPSE